MNSKTNKSPSTMKYLSMILALAPSVAAFHGNPLVKAVPSSNSIRRGSMTRLQYISGAEHDHTMPSATPQQQATNGSTWWSGIFGRGEQSSAADEYLEFLDKRYNSILKDGEAESQKGFSVMDWLYPNGKEATTVPKQRQEDALYVLGVAGLASKKFLQRHRHRLPQETTPSVKPQSVARRNSMVVTDAEIVEETSTSSSTVNPPPASAVVAVFQQVARRRERMLQQQTKSFRYALAVVARSIVTGPARAVKAMEKLFDVGGGKQSLAMTAAALAALSLLLRPLLRVAAVEGASQMSP